MSERVLWVSGHRTDDAGRLRPRFPEERAGWVRERIARWFSQHDVGPSWTVLTGGARGADLIAAEEALRLGAHVQLCLALEPAEFLRRSVCDGPNSELWEQSFAYVSSRATVEVLPIRANGSSDSSVFAQANSWMLAKLEAADEPHALLVWDGAAGSEGGTGDAARTAYEIVRKKS